MHFEYVALTWQTHRSQEDPVFGDDMRELLDEKWEEVCRAALEPSRIGGACIMRRPKAEEPSEDAPRMWTEREIEEIAKRYYWRRANEKGNANTHPHVGSNPFCQCDECTEYLKEETNG